MSDPLRILFLTQVLPYPLDAGPKVRAYYVLRYLAERGHRLIPLRFVGPRIRRSIDHLKRFVKVSACYEALWLLQWWFDSSETETCL